MKNTTRLNTLGRGQNILLLYWKRAFATALCALAYSDPGVAQVVPPSILQIDVANNVLYLHDTSGLLPSSRRIRSYHRFKPATARNTSTWQ